MLGKHDKIYISSQRVKLKRKGLSEYFTILSLYLKYYNPIMSTQRDTGLVNKVCFVSSNRKNNLPCVAWLRSLLVNCKSLTLKYSPEVYKKKIKELKASVLF